MPAGEIDDPALEIAQDDAPFLDLGQGGLGVLTDRPMAVGPDAGPEMSSSAEHDQKLAEAGQILPRLSFGPFVQRRSYFGGMRMPPSSRITSPFR